MPETPSPPARAPHAVFLSYASQDVAAERRIAEALGAAGVEVWLDQSELGGGDQWDAKLRLQIAECALFLPLISASTQARREGYFRLEWKLAAERTHMMSQRTAFLLPVVIDATRDAEADVPGEFKAVQWTRLPAGETNAAFCARVKKLLGGSDVAGVADPGPASARPATTTTTSQVGRRVPAAAWAIAAIAIAGAATFLALQKHETSNAGAGTRPPTAEKSATADPKSVAVLAFANMSEDKENTEYFSDGISEEILNALDRNPTLRVTPRTSSFSFKVRNVPLDEIGRALSVARVIEGSVRKAGNRVLITVKLRNAADGSRVWGEEFDRELTTANLFDVQAKIATKVAQKLGGSSAMAATAPGSAAIAPTKNLAAYDLYLCATTLLRGGGSGENALEAVRLVEEAVRLDPDYALAWARLSQAFLRLVAGFDRSGQNAAKARSAATNALRLAPDSPEARLAMAEVRLVVDFDHEATQRELDEAERLRSNNPEVLAMRVRLENARGHWGEALVRLITRAAELDPQNSSLLATLGLQLTRLGQFAGAERLEARAWAVSKVSHGPIRHRSANHLAWTGDAKGALAILQTIPENLPDNSDLTNLTRAELHTTLGNIPAAIADYERLSLRVTSGRITASGPRIVHVQSLCRQGQLEAGRGNAARAAELFAEALAAARQYTGDFPDQSDGANMLARVHAVRGEKSEAVAAMDGAMRISTRTRAAAEIRIARQAKAEVLTLLGETDAAIAELRAVHEMGYAFGYLLRVETEWESLRGDAKFQQLMKEAEARADAQPRPKK